MSMYNMLFGVNQYSDLLLSFLGLTKGDFARFRDVSLTKDGNIAVYTRLGGGNRECWCSSPKEHSEDGCYGRTIEQLQKHPHYLSDQDDDFDSTYATFYFSVPDQYKEITEAMPKSKQSNDDKWTKKLDEIKAMKLEDLRAKFPEICQVLDKITEKL